MLSNTAARRQEDGTYVVDRKHLVGVCLRAKRQGYVHLSLITAVDWQDRWEVVYHLVRFGRRDVLTLRVLLPYREPWLPSLTGVWPAADWHERETYDLMGIRFLGHPDLRRILLPTEFEGFPLRKEVKHGNRS